MATVFLFSIRKLVGEHQVLFVTSNILLYLTNKQAKQTIKMFYSICNSIFWKSWTYKKNAKTDD